MNDKDPSSTPSTINKKRRLSVGATVAGIGLAAASFVGLAHEPGNGVNPSNNSGEKTDQSVDQSSKPVKPVTPEAELDLPAPAPVAAEAVPDPAPAPAPEATPPATVPPAVVSEGPSITVNPQESIVAEGGMVTENDGSANPPQHVRSGSELDGLPPPPVDGTLPQIK